MEKIEERIAKLLSLSRNNDNVHEAESAMRMVEKLLAEHNLSLSGITDIIDGGCHMVVNQTQTIHMGLYERNGTQVPEWFTALTWCITTAYPVKIILSNRGQTTWVQFLGVAPDADIAKSMYDYLYRTMFRAWAARSADITDKRSFFYGFATTLFGRLHQMVNERDANLGAIVLVKSEAVDDYAKEKFGELEKLRGVKSKQTKIDYLSYRKGVIAGESAGIPFDTGAKKSVNA